ncbi:uncharacterized protein [Eucyclogobius newberryi]|uniref:uncharacterized protein isoform X1 n=1 Tax=Eucyclogobius newberryi TaxID=166745 RepID=UPI003B5AF669
MRNLCLVILVGVAAGFFTEKILVSSQPPSAGDDLYLEGRASGDLPIDDEDGEDDGSGSGSGDYVYITEDAELLKFLNFSKTPIGRDIVPVEPLQPQPTGGAPHFGPTTAAKSPEPSTTAAKSPEPSTTAAKSPEPSTTASDSAPKAPTLSDNKEEVMDLRPTMDRATQATSPVPPAHSTTFGNGIESDIEKAVVRGDFNIPEFEDQNEIVIINGRGGRIYEADVPKQVTSENMWERTDVLAAIIACGVVGFLCAVFLLLLLAYRMKKKDEGSYDLGETKLTNTAYHKAPTKEFYA